MDWSELFQPQIIGRGRDYYERGMVTNVHLPTTKITAIVLGSERYHVEIDFDKDGNIRNGSCDCPYALGGENCKHMAAVLFYMDEEPTPQPADTDVIAGLVAAATEKQVRDFLTQVLCGDAQLAKRFELITTHWIMDGGVRDYQSQIDEIFESYMDSDAFIDYDEAEPFEEELSAFIREAVQPLIDDQQLSLAFRVINVIVERLSDLDIDDSDGEIMRLSQTCSETWGTILAQSDLLLKRRALKWFQKRATEDMGAFKEAVTDILFSQFKEPEFLQEKLEWTAQQLHDAEQLKDDWDRDYLAEKWATSHVKVMAELGRPAEEIEQFCLANLRYQHVLQYYVNGCVQRQDYSAAIRVLREGKQLAGGLSGVVLAYSQRLKTLYKKLGQTEDYRHELWLLLTAYAPADIDCYRELKQQYSAEEWPMKRDQLFKALPVTVNQEPLYAEDHLNKKLLAAVMSEHGLNGVRTYAHLLAPKFSDQLVAKYSRTVQKMAEKTGDRKHYRELAAILNEMTDYPSGYAEATRIVQEWRVKYVRRPAMMDELRRFDNKKRE